jgi:tetratricopeptide (TPR) repeat protein
VATLPPELRARYVEGRGDRHTVVPTVKSLVRFARHNLVVDPLPAPGSAGFDVVTCRNVLIYFDRTTAETVVRSLRSAVMPGGQLVLGVADALAGTMSAPVSQPRRPLARRSRPSRPVRRVPAPPTPPSLAHALAAADAGDLPETIALTSEILAADTLDADAHFVLGLAELASGAPAAAVSSLRRALYLDPAFGLAAFKLGRAWDALGDDRAARRAYARALDALQSGAQSHADMLGHVDLADVADACRARLLAPADDGARIP